MQCVVLAGGLGTRMSEYTKFIPKAMIPVNGVPFIDLQLDRLLAEGVEEVVLSLGYKGELVEEHLRGRKLGPRVRCHFDGPVLRGTAGALKGLMEADLLAEVFLLTYGDSYLTCNFNDVLKSFDPSAFEALMVVQENSTGYEPSNAEVASGSVVHYSKEFPSPSMGWIDYGLSVLTRIAVEKRVPSNQPFDLARVFDDLATEGLLQAYITAHRYYEIGSTSGLKDLEVLIKENWS